MRVFAFIVKRFRVFRAPLQMAPVLEELAGDYDGKADILKLDVDENPSTAAKFEVMSIPTLIVFKDGEPVDKVVGFQPKENLAEVLDKHL
ncbi:thioredoxin family protein [Staphylococcus haemolyticus]